MLTSMKGEINDNTIKWEILIPHSHLWIDQLNRKLTRKQTLNDAMDQLDQTDIYRTFHPKTVNFTFFSSAYGTFSRIDHILDHKYSLSKFKKTEIISSIFSDHNVVRLDVNYRKKKKLLKIQTYGG